MEEIPMRKRIDGEWMHERRRMLIFLVGYCTRTSQDYVTVVRWDLRRQVGQCLRI